MQRRYTGSWRAAAMLALWLALVAPPASYAQSFLWEARDGDRRVFLMGSIHIGRADFYPLPEAVQAAFAKSDVLAVEADASDPQATLLVMQKGVYGKGDSLEQHLRADTVKRLKAILPRYGLSWELMANLRPFTLYSTLVMAEGMRLGYDPQAGVDLHFIQKARESAMPIVELESIAFQVDMMNSFSDAEMDMLLGQTLQQIERDTMGAELKSMTTAWRAGDAAALWRVVQGSFGEDHKSRDAIMEKLNTRRNRAMTDKIEGYLKSGKTHFVVVGALHLVGDEGIVSRLRQKNFKIVQH